VSKEPSVEFQLGALNVNWDRVVRMKSDLFDIVARQHSMGATAKVNIVSDTAKETGYRLCYTCGIDGMDARYWVEKIPHHHVDWEMTEAEWDELRSVLWWSGGAYTEKLKKDGKLGKTLPAPPPPGIYAGNVGGTGGVNVVQPGLGGGGGGQSVSFSPRGIAGSPTGRGPRPDPQPQTLRPDHYSVRLNHDKQVPVDNYDDTWRCEGCGKIYQVSSGFAICPNDPNPPTGSKVGGGPTIA
jgi:hypothetical protein